MDLTAESSAPDPAVLYDPAALAWAVNLGGEAWRDVDGTAFEADPVSGGQIESIDGVQDPVVYQSYREGELALTRALPDGRYDLTFYFAEPSGSEPGKRVFNVLAQGQVVIPALDIRAARRDSPQSAMSRTVTGVEVTQGELQIQLQAVVREPLLNALVVRPQTPDATAWRLVWNDEFEVDGPPDPGKWNIEVWDPRRVNDEDQAYTDRERNVRVRDGKLILEAHREDYGDARYTSGRIQSRGKGDWQYGRVDFRARLPRGQGSWAALWMMPTDAFRYATTCSASGEEWQGQGDCDAWPNSGEIDVMEHVGYDMPVVHGTVHTKAYYWVNGQQRKGSIEVPDVDADFRVYSLVWSEDRLRTYVDGTPYFTYQNDGSGWQSWPFDHAYYAIMNLAVGGSWGRAGGPIDDSIFPARVEVDYVRVFKPVSAAATPES